MAEGDIGDTVVDSINFEESMMSIMCDICHVVRDIYAIAYLGNDGYIKTISINANGNIGSVIDTLAFSPDTTANYPRLIHISGNVYAVPYTGPDNDGWLKTFSISRASVVGAIIDSLEYDSMCSHRPRMVYVCGSIYAIVYQYSTTTGRLVTLQIERIPVSPYCNHNAALLQSQRERGIVDK